jgi:Pyridoxamine 5'-phosphate oxidase
LTIKGMGKVYEGIDGRLRTFIEAQPVYFVATAPSGGEGHVNLSPKGMQGTLAVLGEHRIAYLDYFGSGAETIAHLRQNGRIVVMFCAFAGPPKILRLHGKGEAVLAEDRRFEGLWPTFDGQERHAVRAIIDIEVSRVSDSCGYAVPLMDHVGERDLLTRSHSRRDDRALAEYAVMKNGTSIDGLPALAG